MSLLINGISCPSLHFAGIFGSGMSAIAQYLRWTGCDISGSDRLESSADVKATQEKLSALGCRLFPQDGSGVGAATRAVVVSTAIESANPDIAAAQRRGIPVFHRSEVLSAIVSSKRTIAVAGTSGKSTVAAMLFEFLDYCGKSASVITGAGLTSLIEKGYLGNAWAGSSDLLVIEADESDGSLVRYHPDISLFLNVSKDHKPVDETLQLFRVLATQSAHIFRNADDPLLASLAAERTYGFAAGADCAADSLDIHPLSSTVVFRGATCELKLPGRYNVQNMLAAFCVAEYLGCAPEKLAEAAGRYRGINRRFVVYPTARGITVVDDYAHNPEKIRAALSAAHGVGKRVLAVFQPHGFGPTRFMKDELTGAFGDSLTKDDHLFLLPIYYAGGTAQKDISSEDIIAPLRSRLHAESPHSRAELLDRLRMEARPGDCVILMGARDPSLEAFARELRDLLG